MRPHRPKTAALMALAAGRLTPAGQARLQAHLGHCPACRRELAAIHAYEGLVQDLRATPPPEISWEAMARAVARDAARQRRGRLRNASVTAVALAAAATLALLLRTAPFTPPVSNDATTDTAHVRTGDAPPEARPLNMQLMATVGEVRVTAPDKARTTATAGHSVAAGSTVRTGPGAQAHLRLATGTGVLLWARTALAVEAATTHRVRLRLHGGVISQRVAPDGPPGAYSVTAGPFRLEVVGTRFAVRHLDDIVEVHVTHGVVQVWRDDALVRVLEGPAEWRSAATGPLEPLDTTAPMGLEPDAEGWPVLDLPASPRVLAWELAGRELAPGDARITTRVPKGSLDVAAVLGSGRRVPIEMVIGPEGRALPEAELGALLPDPVGHLAPERVAETLQQARPELEACYERAMRLQPDLQGRHILHLRLGQSGIVQEAHLEPAPGAAPSPTKLGDCVAQALRKRAFPRPTGGPVTLQVPLSFQQTGAK
jgi:ferric-dicitrate binding protein FerR (iron transport regulator)